ncbi:AT-rich interactive domain-containing protein 5A [Dryobates pubescens]|uniref:AT-rich interactive domain-containing protein 5A n=1 Tax=Dryobates pubescens TaxID=118200 RepID=UPI0023B8EFA9|nr:AT-rich interactive domain-containing protein 5A [Dryobates pubescens]
MKDRHTPIERIPHLGFKQINLWKIYKAVEKLGAYELVTGRRLWKNVYDELGGSPGSTSAATCTRRHYERLVLPYVRHLKGEEDKPLPPSKPRKQYKASRGSQPGEKGRRARKEKSQEQRPPDKVKPEDTRNEAEQGQVAEGSSSPVVPTPSPSGGCPSTCRPHTETYKRLFSSFYSKGNHHIMSPLAKKKLLAQVSKAESLPCHKRHCPEGQRAASQAAHTPQPLRPPTGPHLQQQESPEPAGAQDPAQGSGSEVGPTLGGRETQGCPRAEDGQQAPATFTGCFHACRSEGLKPLGCHPLWGHCSSLKEFLEPPSSFPPSPPEEPQDLRSQGGQRWSGDGQRAAGRGCWVTPGAAASGKRGREEEEEEEEEDDEEDEEEMVFSPSAKLGAISPLLEGRDKRSGGLAKPKAVVASPGYSPGGYTGVMLRFPLSFGNPLEHLKSQGVPVPPALSAHPFIIPAFPSPLVTASTQLPELCRPLAPGPGHYPGSFEGSLRRQPYPAAPWHSPASSSSPHVSAFHHHAKL